MPLLKKWRQNNVKKWRQKALEKYVGIVPIISNYK